MLVCQWLRCSLNHFIVWGRPPHDSVFVNWSGPVIQSSREDIFLSLSLVSVFGVFTCCQLFMVLVLRREGFLFFHGREKEILDVLLIPITFRKKYILKDKTHIETIPVPCVYIFFKGHIRTGFADAIGFFHVW